MNILVVTPKYYPDNFAVNIIVDEFIKLGHQVTVLTSLPYDEKGYLKEYKYLENDGNLTIYRLKAKRRKKSLYSLMASYLSFHSLSVRWVRRCKTKYDVVYTYNVSPVTVLAAGNTYKRKYGIKHIAHVLDVWPVSILASGYKKESSFIYKAMMSWSKQLYKEADKLLIGSHHFEQYIKEELSLSNLDISYLAQPALYIEPKADNPYKENTFNILYVGNINKLQLVNYLVPMMNKLDDKDVHLTIIGEGSYKDELIKEISSSPVKDNIHYLGKKSYVEVASFYKYASSVFVGLDENSKVRDTIPNKLINALAYSKIVIGMIKGEGKEILESTSSNYLINQDVDEFVKVVKDIKALSKNEIKIKEDNNRAYYLSHYSTESIIKELLIALSSK